jgi:hypothetical protein
VYSAKHLGGFTGDEGIVRGKEGIVRGGGSPGKTCKPDMILMEQLCGLGVCVCVCVCVETKREKRTCKPDMVLMEQLCGFGVCACVCDLRVEKKKRGEKSVNLI